MVAECTRGLGLFDDVLVVVERLVEFQLLHVLAVFDFEILRDPTLPHLRGPHGSFETFPILGAVLILRDRRSCHFVDVWKTRLILLIYDSSFHDVAVQVIPGLIVLIVGRCAGAGSLCHAFRDRPEVESAHLPISNHGSCSYGANLRYPLRRVGSLIQIVR